jgi:hypothetical protein
VTAHYIPHTLLNIASTCSLDTAPFHIPAPCIPHPCTPASLLPAPYNPIPTPHPHPHSQIPTFPHSPHFHISPHPPPPHAMPIGIGAALAGAVKHIPMLFVAFVAFGVVALLFLVPTYLPTYLHPTPCNPLTLYITLYLPYIYLPHPHITYPHPHSHIPTSPHPHTHPTPRCATSS